MTMQLSLTTMKTVPACEQAFLLRDIERSNTRVARERRREQGAEKKVRAHLHVCLPLEIGTFLPVHNIKGMQRSGLL